MVKKRRFQGKFSEWPQLLFEDVMRAGTSPCRWLEHTSFRFNVRRSLCGSCTKESCFLYESPPFEWMCLAWCPFPLGGDRRD